MPFSARPHIATSSMIEYMSLSSGIRASKFVKCTDIASFSVLRTSTEKEQTPISSGYNLLRAEFYPGTQLLLVVDIDSDDMHPYPLVEPCRSRLVLRLAAQAP